MAGEAPPESIIAGARAAEQAGYGSFWLSQPREGSTLATLGRIAGVTSSIHLGVGAIPFDGHAPADIARHIAEAGIPLDRLRLGVGSGTGPGSLDRLRHGVEQLRALIEVEIVVAPLGPKMCALAGEIADTVLLNWIVPEYAVVSTGWVEKGASRAGRQRPVIATYVRCALGEASRSRMKAECDRYGGFGHYAAHLERQGVTPGDTTIVARNPGELQERLDRYETVLDHVVVRAITPSDSPDEILELVDAARPPEEPGD